MPHVAVVVPGIMGSRLKLGDDLVWPGPLFSLVLPYTKMTELLSPNLTVDGCIRQYVFTQYQPLFADLEQWGFHEADGTLIDAAYDWRKDNAESAETLAGHLDNAVANHGPDTDITLVAHSMGGLVSRYYLESGRFLDRPAFRCIRRLIMLATPHRGAAIALPLVLGLERCLFLSAAQTLQCCRNPRFPSSYQLLPPPGEPFLWNSEAGTQDGPIDIYDFANGAAAALGLVPENLESAWRFHAALDPARRPEWVRYFCVAGSRQTTITHVTVAGLGGVPKLVNVEPEDGGDGTVPIWSSFLPGVQRLFVGGEHSTIYKNIDLRHALGTLLTGTLQNLAAAVGRFEISLRQRVVEPQKLLHAAVTLDPGPTAFAGMLKIEPALLNPTTGQIDGFGPPIETQAVQYAGVGMQRKSLVLAAPKQRGMYRFALYDNRRPEPVACDELVVQEPAHSSIVQPSGTPIPPPHAWFHELFRSRSSVRR